MGEGIFNQTHDSIFHIFPVGGTFKHILFILHFILHFIPVGWIRISFMRIRILDRPREKNGSESKLFSKINVHAPNKELLCFVWSYYLCALNNNVIFFSSKIWYSGDFCRILSTSFPWFRRFFFPSGPRSTSLLYSEVDPDQGFSVYLIGLVRKHVQKNS